MTPADGDRDVPIAAPPARCVECGQEVPDDAIFRVMRRDRLGRRHVVCRSCADRRHAEARPAPLQIQRTPPPRARSLPPDNSARRSDAVATVARWHRLLNRGQVEELMALIDEAIDVVGPRGASTGAAAFRDWFGRAGVRLVPHRYFQRGLVVVVEEDAAWNAPEESTVVARQRVASVFTLREGRITRIARFDTLAQALHDGGLDEKDQVR